MPERYTPEVKKTNKEKRAERRSDRVGSEYVVFDNKVKTLDEIIKQELSTLSLDVQKELVKYKFLFDTDAYTLTSDDAKYVATRKSDFVNYANTA